MKELGLNTPEYLFAFNEASRLGLADSYAFIGDPAFYNLPIAQMIDKGYAKERAALINIKDKAMEFPLPTGDFPIEKLTPTAEDSKHTSHISVIDEKGNIVATTNTLGLGWGSKFAVPTTGFFFNSHISRSEERRVGKEGRLRGRVGCAPYRE